MFIRMLALFLFLLPLSLPTGALAKGGMAVDPSDCLGCHSNKISPEAFGASPHGKNGCNSCHPENLDLLAHMQGKTKPQKVRCVNCHQLQVAEFAAGVHNLKGLSCADCHGDIHRLIKWDRSKKSVTAVCLRCHKNESVYMQSIHGQAVAKGNPDAPSCSDCHGLHGIKAVGGAGNVESRKFQTDACTRCHGDEKMMERNHLSTVSVESFLASYHGKSYRLGSPELAAGCADCHSAHNVFPPSDPRSTVNQANLVKTCSTCHHNATTLFTKFYPHGEHNDRKNYPILYWTFLAMTGLLTGTFAIFWIHTLLWMFRGFVENRQKMAEAHAGHVHHMPDGERKYKRFEPKHIFLHLTVIISFLGLSLTGLPLKFADQHWAKTFMSFYGGVHYAGLIHRGCAVLTFYYFFSACVMSFDFLFFRKDVQGNFLQRLFGPESLMPNLKDVKDVYGMVRWFLFKGPKPQFERWTYWEKFDFLAVFWGMFAIGGSGLMLWFPEFFSHFLPGWALNVATIVHSDEALLATGFIFTVHFFNTHGRPEKFPMDFVIFNGEISKEEFIEERGDQWQRYEKLGILDKFEAKKTSGVVYDFVLKGFGFIALFTGLTLAALMFGAFIK